jgi:hypothetical protein
MPEEFASMTQMTTDTRRATVIGSRNKKKITFIGAISSTVSNFSFTLLK